MALGVALAAVSGGLGLYQAIEGNRAAGIQGDLARRSFERQRAQNNAALLVSLRDRRSAARQLDALYQVSFGERGFSADSSSARRLRTANNDRTTRDLRTIRENSAGVGAQIANQFFARQQQVNAARQNLGFAVATGALQGYSAGVELETALNILAATQPTTGLSTGMSPWGVG